MISSVILRSLIVAGFTLPPLFLVAAPAFAAELTLKRVMLSTGGVGYYEYEAEVNGTEQVFVNLRLDQMDDVLKSLVVYDDKGGGGTVEMPSRAPLDEIFRNLPVGREAFASTQDLLGALKGAEITVDGPVSASGRILSVTTETAQRDDNFVLTRHRVSIMTRSGIIQFVLEDAETVTFDDPTLKAQVDQALAALARHRERDGRTLTITAMGEGTRKLTIAYVIEAPLWKSSYRLTTAEGTGVARLQGWAQVENASGVDWRDIELTLVSGNPVTFRQALYTAYYVNRPEVPVEVLGRILPPADEGSVSTVDKLAGELGGMGRAERDAPYPPPPPAPAAMAMDEMSVTGSRPEEPKPVGKPMAAESTDAATQVLFRVPSAVSVGNGQSLSVPIIDRDVPGERIALYQPGVHPRHPLAAVRLTNNTQSGMPPGVITLYERIEGKTAYVGDAQVSTLPEGETRLVSFALDQKTLIDLEEKFDQRLTRASLARGILTLSIIDRRSTVYTVKAPAREARKLTIEHPRFAGWSITAPDPKTIEQTETSFRIPLSLEAGQEQKLSVTMEYPRVEEYTLTQVDTAFIEQNITNSQLSEPQRQAFAKMREMRREIDLAEAELAMASAERDRIFQEQARIRQNLEAVPERSDLAQRYLAELTAQEDQLARLNARIKEAEARRDKGNQALADFVGELAL